MRLSALIIILSSVFFTACKKRANTRTQNGFQNDSSQSLASIAGSPQLICLKKINAQSIEILIPQLCQKGSALTLHNLSQSDPSLQLTDPKAAVAKVAKNALSNGPPTSRPLSGTPQSAKQLAEFSPPAKPVAEDAASTKITRKSFNREDSISNVKKTAKQIADSHNSYKKRLEYVESLEKVSPQTKASINPIYEDLLTEVQVLQSELQSAISTLSPQFRKKGLSSELLGEKLGYFDGSFRRRVQALDDGRNSVKYALASHKRIKDEISKNIDDLTKQKMLLEKKLTETPASSRAAEDLEKLKNLETAINDQKVREFFFKKADQSLQESIDTIEDTLAREGRGIIDVTLDETRKFAQLSAFRDAVRERVLQIELDVKAGRQKPIDTSIQLFSNGEFKRIENPELLLKQLDEALSPSSAGYYKDIQKEAKFNYAFREFERFETSFRFAVMSRSITREGLINHALGKASKKLNTKAKSDENGFIPVDQAFSSKVLSTDPDEIKFNDANLTVFNWLSDQSRADIASDGLPTTLAADYVNIKIINGEPTEFVTIRSKNAPNGENLEIPKSEFGPGKKFPPDQFSIYQVHVDPRSMQGGNEELLAAWAKENNISPSKLSGITPPDRSLGDAQFLEGAEAFRTQVLDPRRQEIDDAIANAEDLIDSYARFILKSKEPELIGEALELRVQKLKQTATPVVPDNDLLTIGATDTSLLARAYRQQTIYEMEFTVNDNGTTKVIKEKIAIDGPLEQTDNLRDQKIAEQFKAKYPDVEIKDTKNIAIKTGTNFEYVDEKGILSVASDNFYSQGTKGTNLAGLQRNIHHGAEVDNLGFAQHLEKDYPITLVDHEGKIWEIPVSKDPLNPHKHLFEKINELSEEGIDMAINPAHILYRSKKLLGDGEIDQAYFDKVKFSEYQWHQLQQYAEYTPNQAKLSFEEAQAQVAEKKAIMRRLMQAHKENFGDDPKYLDRINSLAERFEIDL